MHIYLNKPKGFNATFKTMIEGQRLLPAKISLAKMFVLSILGPGEEKGKKESSGECSGNHNE